MSGEGVMAAGGAPAPHERPVSLWRWAVWFAVVTGLTQVVLAQIQRLATGHLVQLSVDHIWMAPLANLAIFLLAAAILSATTGRLTRPTAAGIAWAVFLFLWLLGPALLVPRLHPAAVLVLAAGIAVQAGRLARSRADGVDALIRRTLPALVAVVVVLVLGLEISRAVRARRAEAALAASAPGAPNVILVVLDTVRAANLSLHGYPRQTSPRLDEFARTGVVFERALAQSPWTLPSHASLFTGRLPHELTADWLTPLDAAHPTLAEAMVARGYVTAGFSANLMYATEATGLARGFLSYSDYPRTLGTLVHHSWLVRAFVGPARRAAGVRQKLVRKHASQVTDDFLAWLPGRPAKPFFAFLNYFDAHEPYLPQPPFDTKFGPGGPLSDVNVRRTWSREEIQQSMDAYDGLLAYVDQQLGRLLDSLRAQDLLDNTLVVVTSDHGEHFGEHGLFDHANSLYRPLLHVPLVVSFPPRVPSGTRVQQPVSLVDLAATILDLIPAAGGPTLPGQSLAPHWDPQSASRVQEKPLFAEVSKGINLPAWMPVSKGRMLSVVMDGMHYIRNGDGTEEFYDFERDLGETENLAARPEAQAKLAAARKAVDAALKRQ